MKIKIIALVLLCFFLVGCTQADTNTIPDNEDDDKTIENNSLPVVPEYIEKIVDFSVEQCYGQSLRVKNNGTISITFSDSTEVQSRGGGITYTTLTSPITVGAGDSAILYLKRDLKKIGTEFRLLVRVPNEIGGTNAEYRMFNC